MLDDGKMRLDYILDLKTEDLKTLERGLQTQVFKLGLANPSTISVCSSASATSGSASGW